jgi:hypothetical protein
MHHYCAVSPPPAGAALALRPSRTGVPSRTGNDSLARR